MLRRTHRRRAALAAAAALLLAAPAASQAFTGPVSPAAPAAATPVAPTAELAWTARILGPTLARSAPRETASVRARLQHYTAFWRRPQKLLVLAPPEVDPVTGASWVPVRLPGRPNGSMGWVPVDEVSLATTDVRIRVLVGARRVELYRGGLPVAGFRAAVGTSGTPTPTGLFAVQDLVPSSAANRRSLGRYILTLTAYSNVLKTFMGGNGLVAIHGSPTTSVLGRAVSHGCIRISNPAITRLYRLAQPGTPVEIVP
ncbi:MAG: L,D-transpeptidase [Thermoleophilia bacterium]